MARVGSIWLCQAGLALVYNKQGRFAEAEALTSE
jgi:hypothetical protein